MEGHWDVRFERFSFKKECLKRIKELRLSNDCREVIGPLVLESP